MNSIGVMQGRLVPRIDGRIQAFPWRNWQTEFGTAAELGFDAIEFIFEGGEPGIDSHPLLTSSGQAEIRQLVGATGVDVPSICADYFMSEPLFRDSPAQRTRRLNVLRDLIRGAAAVGARLIEIPCVDQSSLTSEAEHDALIAALEAALPLAREQRVNLLLETDLPPHAFAALLSRIDEPEVGANYDTGNSASLGFDTVQEIEAYGDRILNIHIKDRVLHGTTVPLGTGNANFPAFFAALRDRGYDRGFILQTARDPDDVGVARKYLAQVRGWVIEYLAPARGLT